MKKEKCDRTNCCDVSFIENSDICRKCSEHASIQTKEEK